MKYFIIFVLFNTFVFNFIVSYSEDSIECKGAPDVHNELYRPTPNDDKQNSTIKGGYYENGRCPSEGYECTNTKYGAYCCETKNVCNGDCCLQEGETCHSESGKCLLPF